MNRLLPWLAAAGFLDALYLTIEHYLHTIPPCTITAGCETVLTSQYATFLGIPVALLGVIYYLTSFTIALKIQRTPAFAPLLMFIVSSGLIVSGILLYIQAALLEAYCLFCLVSALLTLLIFLVSWRIVAQTRMSP